MNTPVSAKNAGKAKKMGVLERKKNFWGKGRPALRGSGTEDLVTLRKAARYENYRGGGGV